MAYCGILDGMSEINGEPVDLSRIDEGVIIAGDETYEADDFISEEDRLDLFNEMSVRTKEALLKDIDSLLEKIREESKGDPEHSLAFYDRYMELVENFRDKVAESVFPAKLEDWWRYGYTVCESGVTLSLSHIDSFDIYANDTVYEDANTTFELMHIKSKLLTVEQYAQAYGVTTTTVRQWIRRGKIRTAIKMGSEWRIPELAEILSRGYGFRQYERKEYLADLPEGFGFFNDYDYVNFEQDRSRKDLFNVCFSTRIDTSKVPEEEWGKYSKTIQLDQKEREKFELYLIGNPFVESGEAILASRN